MKYEDLKFQKMPKYFMWHRVQFLESKSDRLRKTWCTEHQSSGRFYTRKSQIKDYNADWESFTDWYFEEEGDALIFALKFT